MYHIRATTCRRLASYRWTRSTQEEAERSLDLAEGQSAKLHSLALSVSRLLGPIANGKKDIETYTHSFITATAPARLSRGSRAYTFTFAIYNCQFLLYRFLDLYKFTIAFIFRLVSPSMCLFCHRGYHGSSRPSLA